MLTWIKRLFPTRQERCARRGHAYPTDPTLQKVAVPESPRKSSDYEIFEHTKQCTKCGAIYRKEFAHFRGGLDAFIGRGE